MNYLITALVWLLSSPATAQEMSRHGTMNYTEDTGYGDSTGVWLLLLGVVALSFVLYHILKATYPNNSTELNANLAWMGATALIFVILSVL